MRLNQDFVMAVETILYLKKRKRTGYIQSAEIAKALNFSIGYQQKVVQTLGRHGILECKRGRIGGVRMMGNAVTLRDVWQATSGGLDSTNPPVAVMEKPLRAFRDAMSKVAIYGKAKSGK